MASSHRVHFFHLVWSTKNRKDFILPKIKDKLYAYMGGVIRKSGGALVEIGGIPNHVHLLVEISNLDYYTRVVRNCKASSTRWLKQEFPECHEFAWQDGLGSFGVSVSQLDRSRQYLRNQEQHHKNQSFEDEYRKLLRLHNVDFDERYLFD